MVGESSGDSEIDHLPSPSLAAKFACVSDRISSEPLASVLLECSEIEGECGATLNSSGMGGAARRQDQCHNLNSNFTVETTVVKGNNPNIRQGIGRRVDSG